MEENENNQEETPETAAIQSDNSNKNMNMVIIVVAVILLVLGGVYMFSRRTSTNESATDVFIREPFEEEFTDSQEFVDEDVDSTLGDEANEVSFTVVGGSYYFEPNLIEVNAGDTVRIVFESADMTHDFVIDELNVRTPIVASGRSAEVEFTVDTPGEYEFYCSVTDHKARGMVGTLIVK